MAILFIACTNETETLNKVNGWVKTNTKGKILPVPINIKPSTQFFA